MVINRYYPVLDATIFVLCSLILLQRIWLAEWSFWPSVVCVLLFAAWINSVAGLIAYSLTTRTERTQTIEDGFGNTWENICHRCGGELSVVRPGKVQCNDCGW